MHIPSYQYGRAMAELDKQFGVSRGPEQVYALALVAVPAKGYPTNWEIPVSPFSFVEGYQSV